MTELSPMLPEERECYSPLNTRGEKGRLESNELILPPLDPVPQPKKRCFRKMVIGTTALSIIMVLILAVVIAILLTTSHSVTDRMTPTNPERNSVKQIKPALNFQIDLRRAYENIMERKTMEELKTDFEYYWSELFDVRNAEDLKDFLVLLRLNKVGYDLTKNDIDYAFRTTKELLMWYSFLDGLKINLTKYETQKHLKNFHVTPDVKMDARKTKEMEKLMREWTQPMSTVITDSRVIFKKKVLLLSEVVDMMETDSKLTKPEIYIFASNVIYLDADIFLPGRSIAIIAPRWCFINGINIFISGLNGVKHERKTAHLGKSGLPGHRGGNGGHFFGIGNINEDYLQVYSDGGDGGDGQHGMDGRNGTDIKPMNFNSSDVFRCKEHLKDVVNKYGELICYYKVYNAFGCGTNGTDGGAPGLGGKGGHIILMDVANGSTQFHTGKEGSPGNGGRGGSGGRGADRGCYYYAEGKKDGKLHAVTAQRCGSPMPSGFNGRDSFNTIGLNESENIDVTFFPSALRHYRIYAREEYLHGDVESWKFLQKLDELPLFINITRVQDFIDEMRSIDVYEKSEFYKSLNRRIEIAMEYPGNREKLTYLRALSYGKILSLKRELNNYVIVDLDLFLEKVTDDLQSTDRRKLPYKDHTSLILQQLLKGKIEYLRDSLDRWILKTERLTQDYDSAGSHCPRDRKRNDKRNMAYLTSIAARILKSLSGVIFDGGNTPPETHIVINNTVVKGNGTSRFCRHMTRMKEELVALSEPDFASHFKNLKYIMTVLNDLTEPESEVSDFPVEMEYFDATVELMETVREKENFKSYIEDVNAVSVVDEETKALRQNLFDALIISQYRDALGVFRQWVFPQINAYDHLLPKKKNLTIEDAKIGISMMRKWIKEYKSTITPYDKYIREASFSSNNTVGEYYKWYNSEIRSDLKELFKGRKILLTADVENSHMFTKNAIKFRTVRLEFQLRGDDLDFFTYLKNSHVEMRHSGYSYYYYNGHSYLQTGEGFDLRYSYELAPNGVPVHFNMVYKKLMEGFPIFSPYTTWAVQLKPVPAELINYADVVDVALVGLGSYIDVGDEHLT